MEIVKKQKESDKTIPPLLTEGSLAARAATWLTACTSEVYLVGGTIRDWLLGRESHDVDFVVAQDSLSLARGLADYLKGYFVPLDRRRGIARVVCYEEEEAIYVDLILLQGQTLAQDLMRRDFTINAIALRLGEEELRLIDPHQGQEDLRRRLVRAVTPHVFADDPLRLLRAVRLAAELEFKIEPQTEELLRRDAPLIELSAAERIRYELVKILRAPQAPRWARFLVDTDLLASIVPQLESHIGPAMETYEMVHQLITALKEEALGLFGLQALAPFGEGLLEHLAQPTNEERCREDVLRMTALLSPLPPEEVRGVLLELRFSGYEAHCGGHIVAHWRKLHPLRGSDISRRTIYRFFREAGDAGVEALLLALAQEGEGQRREQLSRSAAQLLEGYFRRYQEVIAPPLLLNGHALMGELGLEPGPWVGELLAALREAQAVGEVCTPEEALAFVRAWASTHWASSKSGISPQSHLQYPLSDRMECNPKDRGSYGR